VPRHPASCARLYAYRAGCWLPRYGRPARTAWDGIHGYFTPAGFAAIGAAEGLVHGHDIAAGLSIAWTPQLPLCERVLSVVFPAAAAAGPASAFETLLIQTGRAGRPQHQPPPSWSYAAAAALPLSGKP
jgi:hypothetical protein